MLPRHETFPVDNFSSTANRNRFFLLWRAMGAAGGQRTGGFFPEDFHVNRGFPLPLQIWREWPVMKLMFSYFVMELLLERDGQLRDSVGICQGIAEFYFMLMGVAFDSWMCFSDADAIRADWTVLLRSHGTAITKGRSTGAGPETTASGRIGPDRAGHIQRHPADEDGWWRKLLLLLLLLPFSVQCCCWLRFRGQPVALPLDLAIQFN